MFRYVFSLLLVNTFYQSLGVPVQEPKAHFLTYSLKNLADKCGNQFLAGQIKNRTDDCSVVAPPYRDKQLQCLMFYDINSQLCAAASKLSPSADSMGKINEEQDINTICYNVKDWTFTNLTDYIQYKGMVERYSRYPVTCGKICGQEEIVSENANFFCKYFNWGNELLKNITQTNETQLKATQIAAVPLVADSPLQADKKLELNPMTDHNLGDQKLIPNNQPGVDDPLKATSVSNEISTKNEIVKPESTSNKMVPSSAVVDTDKDDDADLNVGKINEHSEIIAQDVPSSDLHEKTDLDDPSKLSGKAPLSDQSVAEKDAGLDTSKLKQTVDGDGFYPDDDSKGAMDFQGGEGDEGQVDIDQGQGHSKNLDKVIEPINGDLSQKTIQEYYPNPIQEGFSEDEDHFFSFFLTVVILVVLLYILYHNKSKVSKVFLGLIFEGRQSGRRRTSRGHAYRRLDTLEQAMNNKSGAPPSKIIY